MPIKDIEGLEKMVTSLGTIELKSLIRRGTISESLEIEKKIWNIRVEKKIWNLLTKSSQEMVNHFEENRYLYRDEWINKIKETFNITEIKDNPKTKNWGKNISQEKNQAPNLPFK